MFSKSKSIGEEVFQLKNPLVIQNPEKKIKSSASIRITKEDSQQPLISETTKLALKPDKRTKKDSRDLNRDSDWSTLKSKVKKKNRSKINLEENLESVKLLLGDADEIEETETRTKATSKTTPSFHLNHKLQSSETEKKSKKTNKNEQSSKGIQIPVKPEKIVLTDPISIEDLSNIFSIPKSTINKSLFLKGLSFNVNQIIDISTVQKLGKDFGIEVILAPKELKLVKPEQEILTSGIGIITRPPIVTILGHINHGKTTLLDKIRKTYTAQKEPGKITQKISTYEVSVTYGNEDRKIIFIDTPGHEAFYGMRFRGMYISDIAVLVVAADEGIRSQTVEVIQQINHANMPVIVAITKIDTFNANVEAIKKELTNYNLVPKDWGGDTLIVEISALQEKNITLLLETILLQSDTLNLQSKTDVNPKGIILESSLDKTKGATASIILKEGILKLGDTIVIENVYAKIRGMLSSAGEPIQEAYPSYPINIWGLPKIPIIGENFVAFKSEKDAKIFANSGNNTQNLVRSDFIQNKQSVASLESTKYIDLIIKADTQGSIEAIVSSLKKFATDAIQVRILQFSVGEVTETDLKFANISKSNIIAFNTTCSTGVKKLAKNTKVQIKEYNVIDNILEDISLLVEEQLGSQNVEKLTGYGVVKSVFPLAKSFVAGTAILEGTIYKTSYIHVVRNTEIIYKGYIDSLKKMKEDVLEISEGSECGIFITQFNSWKSGDVIRAFELTSKKKTTR